jgi:hypothetical protein
MLPHWGQAEATTESPGILSDCACHQSSGLNSSALRKIVDLDTDHG